MTVITRDGKLYSFLVDYAKDPQQLTIGFSSSANIGDYGAHLSDGYNQCEIQANAAKISVLDKSLRGFSAKTGGVRFSLLGVYIKGDLLYYQLECSNKSPISYDIESIRFFSSDTRSPKRGAVQQLELHPVQTFNDTARVGAGESIVKVFAVPKMTMEAGKRLQIQINERSGGRHASIALGRKTILKARQI